MLRQRQQANTLVGEQVDDAATISVARRAPRVRDLGDPTRELRIEIFDGRESSRGEERVTEVLDLALDFPFFVSAVRRARLGREVVVAGEVEDPRVKPNVIASALEDDALEIVVLMWPIRLCADGSRPRQMSPQSPFGGS